MSLESANQIARCVLNSDREEKEGNLAVLSDFFSVRGDATIAEIAQLLSQKKEAERTPQHTTEWRKKIIDLLNKETDEWESEFAHLAIQKLANEEQFLGVEFSKDMRSVTIDGDSATLTSDGIDIVTKTPVRNLKVRLGPNIVFPCFATAFEADMQDSQHHYSSINRINEVFSEQQLREAGVEDPVELSFTGGVFMQIANEELFWGHVYSKQALQYIGVNNPMLSARFHIDKLRVNRHDAGILMDRMEDPYISVEKVAAYNDAFVFTNITELPSPNVYSEFVSAMRIHQFIGSDNDMRDFSYNVVQGRGTFIDI